MKFKLLRKKKKGNGKQRGKAKDTTTITSEINQNEISATDQTSDPSKPKFIHQFRLISQDNTDGSGECAEVEGTDDSFPKVQRNRIDLTFHPHSKNTIYSIEEQAKTPSQVWGNVANAYSATKQKQPASSFDSFDDQEYFVRNKIIVTNAGGQGTTQEYTVDEEPPSKAASHQERSRDFIRKSYLQEKKNTEEDASTCSISTESSDSTMHSGSITTATHSFVKSHHQSSGSLLREVAEDIRAIAYSLLMSTSCCMGCNVDGDRPVSSRSYAC